MNALIRKFDASMITVHDARELQNIQNFNQQLAIRLTEIDAKIIEQSKNQQEQLAKSRQQLQEEIAKSSASINLGCLIQDDIQGEIPDMQVALKDIAQVKSTLNDISKQIQKQKDKEKNLTQYTNLMKLNSKRNAELEDMEQKFNDRKLLWTNVEKFAKKSNEWMTSNFLNLNVEEIEKDMKFFEVSNAQLQMRVENLSNEGKDKVLDFFTIEVKQLNVQMPLISALGNVDLRERHWDQIFKQLNPNYNPGRQFTFQEL